VPLKKHCKVSGIKVAGVLLLVIVDVPKVEFPIGSDGVNFIYIFISWKLNEAVY
jgi:hypothetical protein